MAKRAKPNAKTVQKIKNKPFNFIKGFLVLVGKPFYYIILFLFLAISFLLTLPIKIGFKLNVFRVLLQKKLNKLFKKGKTKKLSKKKITKSSFKPLPIPTFNLIGVVKIIFLKIRLIFEKLFSLLNKNKLPKFSFKKHVFKPRWGLLILIIIIAGAVWLVIFKDLPSPRTLTNRAQEISTKIYDRNGILLYKIYKNKNRTLVPLNTIPDYVQKATLAAEDAEFYNHLGFSVRGITRSFFRNIKKGELTGGSTITQQLVKNALLTPEKTISRKIKELVLSVEIEFTYSKDKIFEMYLNEVPYGGTAYGIEEASQQYFGKKVGELTLSEAALLAGLPKSPTKYSPFGTTPELSFSRQREVLDLMVINHYITKAQAEEAKARPITFSNKKKDIKAPHFVMYVRNQLVEKYGEEVVETGGLEVITTLDYNIQQIAEKAVSTEIAKLKGYRVGNGASLVLDPKTGEILAMVGSKDYFDIKNDGNVNVTTSLRQPGSSIKMINYTYALSNNYNPATIIDDSAISYSVPGQPVYSPKNYDSKFRGKITLRSALAESRNIPAVKVLASYGVSKMIDLGKKMGITTWNDPSRYGLSLTLGGGEVKLIDLAIAYSTIANEGKKPNLSAIKKITNYQGKILENNRCLKISSEAGIEVAAAEASNFDCNQTQVVDPRVAFLITDILKDNNARTPAFGPNSSLVIPGHPEVAVKTGTSNDLKDNLTLGYTQNYLVAVWVGNNDSSPMSYLTSGITGAAPIFKNIMVNILKDIPSIEWTKPEGVIKLSICPLTGTLNCTGCSGKMEYFLKENAPTKYCTEEQIKQIEEEKKASLSGQLVEPAVHFP